MVPQSQNSSDSEASVEDYISLFAQWQEIYKEIIQMGFIIKNSGILKVLKHKKN